MVFGGIDDMIRIDKDAPNEAKNGRRRILCPVAKYIIIGTVSVLRIFQEGGQSGRTGD